MPDYIKPKPKDFHTKDSPNDWWSEFVAELEAVERKNQEVYKVACAAYGDMLRFAAIAYGTTSTEYRYLKSRPPKPAPNFKTFKGAEWNKWRKFLEQQEKKERQHDYRQRQNEAVSRLEAMGYVIGEDFQRSNAISFEKLANEADSAKVQEYRKYEA